MSSDCEGSHRLGRSWLRSHLWWLLFLAVLVRLAGLQHDLPYSFYGDEAFLVKRSLRYGSGDLNPRWFHKPALHSYLLFAEYTLVYGLGHLLGIWKSVDDYAVQFVRNPAVFYVVGRLTSLAFGCGTVAVVYGIGRRHFSHGVAVLAALALALSFGHVESSRVVKEDVPCAFFIATAMLFLLRYLGKPDAKQLLLAGFLGGLGTATKYYGILLGIAVVAAPWFVKSFKGKEHLAVRLRSGAIALALFWAGYFVGSPYNFIDPIGRQSTFAPFSTVIDRGLEMLHLKSSSEPGDFIETPQSHWVGLLSYFRVILSREGMGPIVGVLSFVGMAMAFRLESRERLFLALYSLAFIAASVFAFPGYAEPRHQVPVYPFLALFAADIAVRCARYLGLPRPLAYAGVGCFILFALTPLFWRSLELSRPDSRCAAKEWIESTIPAGTKVLIDEDGPPLLYSVDRLAALQQSAASADPSGQFTAHYETYLKYQELAAKNAVSYGIYEIRIPWWRQEMQQYGTVYLTTEYDRDMGNPLKPVGVESIDAYVKEGVKYAVVHDRAFNRFMRPGASASQRFPAYGEFYRELFRRGELIKEFSPAQGGCHGPVVKIFRLPTGDDR